MSDYLIFTATHDDSRRSVLVAEENDSVWAYLTAPMSTAPVSDCWLLNLIDAPAELSRFKGSDRVPPVPERYLVSTGAAQRPLSESVRVQWSADGDAVQIWVGSQAVGFIVAGQPRGYSQGLAIAGPFGQPYDTGLARRLFD